MTTEKIDLKLENRDGNVYAVKTIDGKYFLVLTSDTFHNEEKFNGMGSTEQIEISESTFNSLTQ